MGTENEPKRRGVKMMNDEEAKVPMSDVVGNRRAARMKRVIEFDAPVLVAAEETAKRLQGSGQDIDFNTFVEMAVMRELRRREVTWWEARVSKAMRVIGGGVQSD
jgi:hypothetical protein